MKKKSLLTLDDDFIKYCELNNITDIDKLAKKIFQRGFTIEKYGETPSLLKGKETVVEKQIEVEKIVEVIKEVPVEKIVQVIKEVPIEVKGKTQIITKEVIKEIPVVNNEELDKLKKENEELKEQLNKLTSGLDKIGNRAKYLKGSDLNNLYDE